MRTETPSVAGIRKNKKLSALKAKNQHLFVHRVENSKNGTTIVTGISAATGEGWSHTQLSKEPARNVDLK